MEFSNSSFVDLVNPEKLFFIGNRNFEFVEIEKENYHMRIETERLIIDYCMCLSV